MFYEYWKSMVRIGWTINGIQTPESPPATYFFKVEKSLNLSEETIKDRIYRKLSDFYTAYFRQIIRENDHRDELIGVELKEIRSGKLSNKEVEKGIWRITPVIIEQFPNCFIFDENGINEVYKDSF